MTSSTPTKKYEITIFYNCAGLTTRLTELAAHEMLRIRNCLTDSENNWPCVVVHSANEEIYINTANVTTFTITERTD